MASDLSIPGLTIDGCRGRQRRLRRHLEDRNLDAALIFDRRHVNYFTGYWCGQNYSPALLIDRDGSTILATPGPPTDELAADEVVPYQSNHIGTLVDDQLEAAITVLDSRLAGLKQIGCDTGLRPGMLSSTEPHDLFPVMLSLRRKKDADEVALLKRAIQATESAYRYARDTLKPGMTEVDLFAGMQAAAAADVGETLGQFGNDFQIGSIGSPPRRRQAQAGEVAIFDLSVVVRGYSSDMCRSFVVGGVPSELQQKAYDRVMQTFAEIENMIRPGVSCRDVYDRAKEMLDGYEGWSFPHHLGHGIGLNGHEGPRLNPHWDDALEVGHVIAVEPGLYHRDLKAGLRIEQVFLVTEDRLEQLTSFPTELA